MMYWTRDNMAINCVRESCGVVGRVYIQHTKASMKG